MNTTVPIRPITTTRRVRRGRIYLGISAIALAMFVLMPSAFNSPRAAHAATVTINVGQSSGGGAADEFNANTVTITAGDTVHWQRSAGTHNMTSYDESTPGTAAWGTSIVFFNSAGKTFDKTFDTPGTFTYYCSLHASRPDANPAAPNFGKMVGKIVVQAASVPTLTGTPSATHTVPAGSTATPIATHTPVTTHTATTTRTPAATGTPTVVATPKPNTHVVNMINFAFEPKDLTVRVGDTVQWVNNSDTPHTSTSDASGWDSNIVLPGASFSFTFTGEGTFAYHCSFHQGQGQTGKITVQKDVSPTPTGSPAASPTAVATVTAASAVPTAAESGSSVAASAVQAPPRAPQTVEVQMKEFAFSPPTITVALGDTVRWRNAGTVQHNTTSDGGAWKSTMLMNPGDTFEYTFTSLGTFTYKCSLHSTLGQRGTVIVQMADPGTGSILPSAGSGADKRDRLFRIALAAALGMGGLFFMSTGLRAKEER